MHEYGGIKTCRPVHFGIGSAVSMTHKMHLEPMAGGLALPHLDEVAGIGQFTRIVDDE